MSELTIGVNSTETLWTVDEVPDPEFEFYTVGSEIVRVSSGAPGGDPGYAVGQTYPATIRVRRGTNGTTAAAHLAGAALTAANAFAGGGGGLDVTDGTVTVAGATTLSVPEVTDEGGGVAAVFQPGFIVSASDPGAVGTGTVWKDVSGGIGDAATWWERNAADDGWEANFAQVTRDVNGFSNVGPTARTTGSGPATAGALAFTSGSGDASADVAATSSGSGDASASLVAEAGVGAFADAEVAARISGTTAGLNAWVDGGVPKLGFNGTTPITIPIVPQTTPDVQNVIDALVALGLVTQSD